MSEKETTPLSVEVYAPDNVGNKKQWVKLVKEQLLTSKGTEPPNVDLLYFLEVCKSTGLNPLSKQIYAIYRGGRLTIQAGIDGLRAVAERSGLYAGSDAGEFDEEGAKPKKCTVTVYKINRKTGERMPTVGVARWEEYAPSNPKLAGMWNKMPYTMLEKCAEAKALRKAFPNCAQVYAEEEMHQADSITVVPKTDEEVKQVKADAKKIAAEITAKVEAPSEA